MGDKRRKWPWGWRETVVAAAIAMSLPPISLGLWQQTKYGEAASQKAKEYTSDAENEATDSCFGVAPVKFSQCLSKAHAQAKLDERRYEHDEDDLVAQQSGALWTAIMGFAAVLGMGLSVVGVYLVWTTFRETLKANEIAMAERAPSIHVDRVDLEERGDELSIAISFRNYGGGEALRYRMSSIAAFINEPISDEPLKFIELGAPHTFPQGGTKSSNLTLPNLGAWREKLITEKAAVLIGVRITYSDRFGREYDDPFWYFSSGARYVARIVSVYPKWTAQQSGKDDPKQPRLAGV